MKEYYPWISIGIVIFGFLVQGFFGSFRLGQAVGEMKASFKEQIDEERQKAISKIDAMEARFDQDQSAQDHNFGEVGAAMRQYIADVEKKIREVEIWGRDNYVLKGEFEKATDRLEDAIKHMAADIKTDFRNLSNKIDAKP